MSAPVIFLIAGEASGDLLGAHLIGALRRLGPPGLQFKGVGGPRMVNAGLELFFPQQELAHFGLAELLVHVPHLLKRIKQTIAEIIRTKPSALLTIDAPDFFFRVAKQLKGQGVPLIHFVAPTVWAWRPKRAGKIAQFLDHLLVLLPFEPPYFTEVGLPCTFVGHPIIESQADKGDAARFRATHKLQDNTPLLAVLPGSRAGELKRMMPDFAETVRQLRPRHPDMICVMPTLPHLAEQLRRQTKTWDLPVIVTESDQDKYDAFAAATAALACSGTISLELALARLPAVIAYRVSPITAFLYRRLIKARFANLVNIMHDRMVVPEYLQERCQPEKLAAACEVLLVDPQARALQISELEQTASWLGKGAAPPSERAARTVLEVAGLTGRA